jgi:protein gp37
MSDLLHERIDFESIDNVFLMMQKADWHTYQILTKRSKRLAEFGKHYGKFPDNVWIGVSVESSIYKNRIQDLKKVLRKYTS